MPVSQCERLKMLALFLLLLAATDSSASGGRNSDTSDSGCYMWSEFNRVLPQSGMESSAMTRALCSDACASRSTRYFGLVASGKCLCGNSLFKSMKLDPSECDWACSGDFSENCGSNRAIQILETADYSQGRSQQADELKFGDQMVGCYIPGTYNHVLSPRVRNRDNMTQLYCEKKCAEQYFQYFGLRAGRSCYCGNSLRYGRTVQKEVCGWKCSGSQQEACGSDKTILVLRTSTRYFPKIQPLADQILKLKSPESPWSFESCAHFRPGKSFMAYYSGESEVMTHKYCYEKCSQRAAPYFGLTQGNLCMCDYSMKQLKTAPLSLCESKRCSGDNSKYCAGEKSILIFKIKAKMHGRMLQLKNCAQSSTYEAATCDRAIDGNTDQMYFRGSCSHSLASYPYSYGSVKGWWMADLDWPMQVLEVKLYNRADCCSERLNDFYITVEGAVCASYKSRVVFSVRTFPCIAVGRSVRIESHLPHLTLCEVQVFGVN